MTTTLKVKGMSCQHCVMSITKALTQVEGVKEVRVNLGKGEVHLENSKEVSLEKIKKAISDVGYEVIS